MREVVKEALKWLWYHRLPVPIPWKVTTGSWMFLYPDEGGLAFIRSFEKPIVKYLKKYVEPGMACVDVGAEQGFYTLLFRRLVGPSGKVISFEPRSQAVSRLLRNLYLNRLVPKGGVDAAPGIKYNVGNVQIVQKAVGAALATGVPFYVPAQHEARASLAPQAKKIRLKRVRQEAATVTTLDYYMGGMGVDVLKIDAEGSDLFVLQGGRRLLEVDRPLVILEVADIATRQFGYRASDLMQYLQDLEYEVVTVDSYPKGEGEEYCGTYVFAPRERQKAEGK